MKTTTHELSTEAWHTPPSGCQVRRAVVAMRRAVGRASRPVALVPLIVPAARAATDKVRRLMVAGRGLVVAGRRLVVAGGRLVVWVRIFVVGVRTTGWEGRRSRAQVQQRS